MWRLFQLLLPQIFHNPSYLKRPDASTAVCIFYKCATWQMRNQEFCILEIRKCTLTNTQLCTLTNTHPCSWQMHNCGPRWQIRNCQAISQDLTSLSSWWHRRAKIKYFQKSLQWKALNLPSAIPLDKWVRQYGVLSWNTLNRLPIKLECFRIFFFKHGTDLHIWSDAKITSSKWQKKMLAGGMRRNICREWRKYFCKDAANPSEPAERKTSDSELGKESTNAGSQLLTMNLGKWAAHIFPRWESYAGMQHMWARVQPCAANARACTIAHPDATGPQWWWKGNGGR